MQPGRRRTVRGALSLVALAVTSALAGCGNGGTSGVDYALVTVGDPGNASDATGFGAVGYTFRIGKYPVTIAQYATFLNAVAATDTFDLYDGRMTTDLNSAGIGRTGDPGAYRYAVLDNGGSSGNRPITYVTWFDAARFANWMANGQPTGPQDGFTTENGAYAVNGATSGPAVVKNPINPNTGSAPTFAIPLENEWYKAAYYSPELNDGAGGYHLYATQSDAAPNNQIGDGTDQANLFTTVFCTTQSPDYLAMTQNYLSDVGAFTKSPSFYGTFDQSGNVWQWNDLDGTALPYRGLRGGYWWSGSVPLQSVLYSTDATTRADNGVGFRLVSPEAAR